MKRPIVINDEEVKFSYNEKASSLTVSKGNCLVDIKNNYNETQVENYKKKFKDFKYIFIRMTNEESLTFEKLYESITHNSSKEIDEIVQIYGFHPKDVVTYGDTDMKRNYIKNIIPHIKIVDKKSVYSLHDRNKLVGQYIYSFKRFSQNTIKNVDISAIKHWKDVPHDYKTSHNNPKTAGLIVHEDVNGSWQDLMKVLRNPTHGVIIKYYIDSNIFCPIFNLDLEKV